MAEDDYRSQRVQGVFSNTLKNVLLVWVRMLFQCSLCGEVALTSKLQYRSSGDLHDILVHSASYVVPKIIFIEYT